MKQNINSGNRCRKRGVAVVSISVFLPCLSIFAFVRAYDMSNPFSSVIHNNFHFSPLLFVSWFFFILHSVLPTCAQVICRSTQPSTLRWTVKWVSAYELSNSNKWRWCLRIVAANLSADSQPKSVGLVWGLAATRRSVCIHQMNRVNSRNDYVMMTAP